MGPLVINSLKDRHSHANRQSDFKNPGTHWVHTYSSFLNIGNTSGRPGDYS